MKQLLESLAAIIAVVVGGVYGGIVGMLAAVPVASILKLYFFKLVDRMGEKKRPAE